MRKFLLHIFIAVLISQTSAQITFCPPGAEWNYNFVNIPAFGGIFFNYDEKIVYSRDSIIGTETLKVLSHRRHFMSCNAMLLNLGPTLIKQKGDTVFFRGGATQHTWQILYNFACQPGFGWQTAVTRGTVTTNYNFTVDSIKYVMVNGYPLKRLYMGGEFVTERLGMNSFMFRFFNNVGCDGDYFARFLCYSDNVLGLAQLTEYPCNFSGIDGLSEVHNNNNGLRVYPNPTSSTLNIEFEGEAPGEIRLANLLGKCVMIAKVYDQKPNLQLDLAGLEKGIYLLQLYKDGRLIANQKFIKEE